MATSTNTPEQNAEIVRTTSRGLRALLDLADQVGGNTEWDKQTEEKKALVAKEQHVLETTLLQAQTARQGVTTANLQAANIVSKAKQQAQDIQADANQKVQVMLWDGTEKVAIFNKQIAHRQGEKDMLDKELAELITKVDAKQKELKDTEVALDQLLRRLGG